jgi:hypothetical protein
MCSRIQAHPEEEERRAMAHENQKKTDEALLLTLACGATVERAAQTSGLSVRSVYRRLANQEFRGRLQGRYRHHTAADQEQASAYPWRA